MKKTSPKRPLKAKAWLFWGPVVRAFMAKIKCIKMRWWVRSWSVLTHLTSLDKFHQVMSLVVMVCGHHCCGRHRLWPSWVIACGTHDVWPSLSNPIFMFKDSNFCSMQWRSHAGAGNYIHRTNFTSCVLYIFLVLLYSCIYQFIMLWHAFYVLKQMRLGLLNSRKLRQFIEYINSL